MPRLMGWISAVPTPSSSEERNGAGGWGRGPQHDDEVPIYHKKEDRDTLRGLWQLFRDIYGTLYTTNLSVEQVEQFGVNAELFVE